MKKRSLFLAAALCASGLFGLSGSATSEGFATSSYSASSIEGDWAWLLSGQLASRYKFSSIGTANFDGKGGCTLALRENSGANGGYDHNSSACEYEINKKGEGRIDFSLDGEEGAAEFVVGPGRIVFIAPEEGIVAAGEMVRLAPATGSAAAGRWTFLLDGTLLGERLTGAGTMTMSSDGKCSQFLVYNYGTGLQRTKSTNCTYTFAPDGIADVEMDYDNGTGGNMYFVLGKGGLAYFLTKADGEVIPGVATKG